ncbi:MAG: hypothetical protein LBO20_09360, partial [Bifidobacteriaceae bacterium]|nr:hypothetical protein [Bifidobacteriaceae bacterium]
MEYQRRLVDDLLDEVGPELAAIALEGAKGVGKTATATRRARSVLTLTDSSQRAAVVAHRDLVAEL